MNSLPVPVALVVVASEPFGAVVVVVLAVIAVVRKYSAATALPAAAVPEVVTDAAVIGPDTVTLSKAGSENATPVAFVFGIVIPC